MTATATTDRGPVSAVDDVLEGYAAVVRAEMERWLPAAGDEGELWSMVRDYPSRPGKGIRPALLIATCEAFGGRSSDAIAPAVALELLHNAFLVHDDLEDASLRRRGSPTLHELHGMPRAVNAGDALALSAIAPLRSSSPLGARLQGRVADEFVRACSLTVEGQAIELAWRSAGVGAPLREPEDYLELIMQKTCWYTTICPLRVGAIIGTRDRAPLAELNRFGFYLGAAFQIRDDLLNLADWSDAYGKEQLGDLREGKRTLILIHLIRHAAGTDRALVDDYLSRPAGERDDELLRRVLDLMVSSGSIAFAEAYGRGIAAAALDAFEAAFADAPPSRHREFVRAMVPYMLARRH